MSLVHLDLFTDGIELGKLVSRRMDEKEIYIFYQKFGLLHPFSIFQSHNLSIFRYILPKII